MQTGSFGPIVFSVSSGRVLTYSGLSRESSARYHEHNIVGKKPRREFLGENLKKYTAQVRLDAGMGINPAKELQKLDDIIEIGRALPLFFGGDYKGKFTLDSISQTDSATDRDGRVIVSNVTLNLVEYV
jgi:phage protein U